MDKWVLYFLISGIIVIYVLVMGSLLFQEDIKQDINEEVCYDLCSKSYFSGTIGSQIIDGGCYCLLYNGIDFTAVPQDVTGKQRMLIPEYYNQRRD